MISFREKIDVQRRLTVQTIRKLSLNFVTKWRNIRMANDYADRYKLRPNLRRAWAQSQT